MKQGDIGGIETVAMLGKMRSAMIVLFLYLIWLIQIYNYFLWPI